MYELVDLAVLSRVLVGTSTSATKGKVVTQESKSEFLNVQSLFRLEGLGQKKRANHDRCCPAARCHNQSCLYDHYIYHYLLYEY